MTVQSIEHTETDPVAQTLSLVIPTAWAGKSLLIRAWMRPDEAAPLWNGKPTTERHPDRTVPFATEQSLVCASRIWKQTDYCLLREFIVKPQTVIPGSVNEINFTSGDVDERGEFEVGILPTRYGMCGRALQSRPTTLLTDSDWKFSLVRTVEEAENARQAGLSEASDVRLPGHWELQGFSRPTYGGWEDPNPTIGVYSKTFTAASTYGKRTNIVFEGACNAAFVRLNGTWAGRHESTFTPFELDITDLLQTGENQLDVRLEKYSRSSFFDGSNKTNFWYLGGIYRHVYLYTTPETCISGYRYDTSFDKGYRKATVAVTAEITNYQPIACEQSVHVTLTGPGGETFEATTDQVDLPAAPDGWRSIRRISVKLVIPKAAKWSAETPNLYDISIALVAPDRALTDEISDRVGLREVQIDGQLFTVNGVPAKLRGVCRHDFSPTLGYATNEQLWRRDLELMREAGVNAVRMSHYTPNEGFIRLCDESGFYVVHECSALWLSDNGDEWHPDYFVRTRETIYRDMNRACVLIWGIGNEHHDSKNFRRVALYCRRNDSRPIVYAGHPDKPQTDGDIITPHYVGKKIIDYLGGQTLRAVSDNWLPKPVICTEDYTVSRGWWPRNISFTDEFRSYWDDIVFPEPRVNGCFLWEWDDRAVVWQDTLFLSNNQPYAVSMFESLVGPWRETTLPWFAMLKQTYAPVKIMAVQQADSSILLSIRNQYDFLALPKNTLTWRLLQVDEELQPTTTIAEGRCQVSLATHDTKEVTLTTPAVSSNGWKCLESTLTDSARAIIAERTMHFPPATAVLPAPVVTSLQQTASGISMTTADATYTFAQSGRHIEIASRGKSTVISALRPNLWITPPGSSRDGFPDRSIEFDAAELVCDAPGIEGDAIVTVSRLSRDGNTFTIEARYQATEEGLLVDYTANYTGAEMHVPAIGVRFELPVSFDSWQWRGLGPWATYPDLELGADYGVFSAPVVTKRKVGAEIPMAEEPLVGQWEEDGGSKAHTDRCVLKSHDCRLALSLLPTQSVECERVSDMVEVRINSKVGSLGDKLIDLTNTPTVTGQLYLTVK